MGLGDHRRCGRPVQGAAYTSPPRPHENLLILTDPELTRLADEADRDPERHDPALNPDDPPVPTEDLVERLSPSPAKHLAHSLDPDVDVVDLLSAGHSLTSKSDWSWQASQAGRIATQQVGSSGQRLAQHAAAAEYNACRVEVGLRVKALDRHNIGTIEAVDDAAGTITVGFVSAEGNRTAQRELAWHDIVIVDKAVPVHDLSDDAAAALARFRADIDALVTALGSDRGRRFGSYPGEDRHMARAVDQHIAARAGQLAGEQPAWLDQLAGPRPADPIGQNTWNSLIADIAKWRSRHTITGPGLGPVPDNPERRTQWEASPAGVSHTPVACRGRPSRAVLAGRAQPDGARRPAQGLPRHLRDRPRRHPPRDRRRPTAGSSPSSTSTSSCAPRSPSATSEGIGSSNTGHTFVEYAEVSDAIIAGAWGPDAALLLGELHEHEIGDTLNVAITGHAPWLQAALCAFDADDDTPIADDRQITWLNDVADYRQRHNVTTRDPLGTEPIDPEQHDTFMGLLTDLNNARPGRQLDPQELELDVGIEL